MNITTIIATAASTPEPTVEGFILLALLIGFVVGLITVYLLPGVIASKRKHPNEAAIWLLTIFFGWSGFAWIGTLVWSVMPIERTIKS